MPNQLFASVDVHECVKENRKLTWWSWVAAWFVLLPGPGAARASLIYNLVNYPSVQNGGTLSGFMRVLDTAPDDGILSEDEVVSWFWSATHPTNGSTSLTSAEGELLIFRPAHVGITPAAITLSAGQPDGLASIISLFSGVDARSLTYRRTEFGDVYSATQTNGTPVWSTANPPPGSLGGDPWIIAQSVAIPEPSPVALESMLVALLVMGAFAARRSIVFGNGPVTDR